MGHVCIIKLEVYMYTCTWGTHICIIKLEACMYYQTRGAYAWTHMYYHIEARMQGARTCVCIIKLEACIYVLSNLRHICMGHANLRHGCIIKLEVRMHGARMYYQM